MFVFLLQMSIYPTRLLAIGRVAGKQKNQAVAEDEANVELSCQHEGGIGTQPKRFV